MNKKQALKLRNQRSKQIKAATRELREKERRAAARRKLVVKHVSEARLVELAKELSKPGIERPICLLCDEPILKKDLKAEKFFAMVSAKEYLMHHEHFLENGVTRADTQATLTKVWFLVADLEFGKE